MCFGTTSPPEGESTTLNLEYVMKEGEELGGLHIPKYSTDKLCQDGPVPMKANAIYLASPGITSSDVTCVRHMASAGALTFMSFMLVWMSFQRRCSFRKSAGRLNDPLLCM
eukprot:gnl/TRDRNA2_/TRDRNA2_170011_c2_seq2.p1 gnl/TRDRNA2_/TRDRNA2_170011_c2~~gnl/TRDRNA2_/TRDRNA2_170011_c2_seq2.p1  ORF type:complete len:111 (+),score=16.01 gnl/TRDRNA2_/TRDRNA2_170011_c2_seq2:141-473(+)